MVINFSSGIFFGYNNILLSSCIILLRLFLSREPFEEIMVVAVGCPGSVAVAAPGGWLAIGAADQGTGSGADQ